MPFGSGFWTGDWVGVEHPHSFPNPSLTTDATNVNWRQYTLESYVTAECIQGPLNGYQGDDPASLNVGKFLLRRTTDSSIEIIVQCVEPYARGFSADPNLIIVDLMSDGANDDPHRGSYYAPFSKISGSSPADKFTFWVRGSGAGTLYDYYLHHKQPIAFRGVVSEVIGAMLMYAGYTASNIDQASFDDAYDAELNVGPDNNNRPYVWVIPEQGETILATIKRVMQHWSHILTYNKDGKFALRPADSFAEFFVALDNNSNVKEIKTWANKNIVLNKCLAMHGGGYMRHLDYSLAVQPNPRLNAYYEPRLKSDYTQAFIDEYSDSNSITKFGERQFGNRIRNTFNERPGTAYGVGRRDGGPLVRDIPRTISIFTEGDPINVAHYPLVHRSEIKDLIMERFLSNEAQIRTFIEVTQDFMGLDYEIGSVVYVPSELGDFRCIKQTIDYNSLTVTSELIRNFPTEYTTASTAVWAYVNLDDAPVGTTVLSEAAGTMTLEVNLTTTALLDWHYQIYISKDGGPWEEFYTTGWEAETGNLDIQDTWSGDTQSVEVIIRATDDDGGGGQCTPTPWVRMPTAIQ